MSEQGEFLATLHEFLAVLMRRSMGNFLRYTRDSGLSMSQMRALSHLSRSRTCSVSDISSNLGVSSAAVSQMLDRLVQQQLIDRTEDPNDRRGKVLSLTEKGHLLVRNGIEARQGWTSELDQLLTAEEKQMVTRALKILIAKTVQGVSLDDPEV